MKSLLFYFIYAIITIGSCRKVYDVEEEARKLYGEDLNAVLLRFRKTPDYLNILQDKVKGMKEELNHIIEQVNVYYLEEIYAKIAKTFGVTKLDSPAFLRSNLYNPLPLYSGTVRLRQGEQENDAEMLPVFRLDHHSYLHHTLSIGNLNYFKAMGFEYAGRAIHTVIKHMGGDDPSAQSTKQPFEDLERKTKKTTEHDHEVLHSDSGITPPGLLETIPDEPASPPDSLRHSHKKKTSI